MITGAHVLLYSRNADADRAFLRDVLQLHFVDAGHGWLIFRLPPAEAAVHPAEAGTAPAATDEALRADLYLLCDDLEAQIKTFKEKGVLCTGVATERWGIRTTIVLPSGGRLGLYQPTHPTAF
jgi:catechol 2,3-dioxygenase-like lactoylglutathione lyase family enzyme